MTNYPEPPRKENIPTPGTKEQALADLAYLWKFEDPDWMAQRETDWQMLVETAYEDYPKVERKPIGEYFKYGRLKEYLPGWSLVFLTPYNSQGSFLQLFNSSLLDDNDRSMMFGGYVFGEKHFEDCYWFEYHTTLIVEATLGESYCEVIEQTSPRHTKMISPDPTQWCRLFMSKSIKSLKVKREWLPFFSCINYFISALPYALNEGDREIMKLPQLLQLVTESLTEGNLTGRLLIFAQELKDREQEILQAWDIGEQKLAVMKQD